MLTFRYWVHPAFKDVFIVVDKLLKFNVFYKVQGYFINAGFCESPFWVGADCNFIISYKKFREFKKFKTSLDAYKYIRRDNSFKLKNK